MTRSNKRTWIGVCLSTLFFALFASVGYSDWFIVVDKNYQGSQILKKTDEPVAYIGSGESKRYFLTIGKAIETAVSGDTVSVIPPTKVEKEDPRYCIAPTDGSSLLTIKSGVTLNIPYAEGAVNNKKPESGGSHALGNSSFLKLSTWVKDGVTLENNGTIEIGGILGSYGGGNPTGCTSGNYAELCLGEGSKLISTGSVNIYGLLGETTNGKDKSEVVFQKSVNSNDKSKLNLPFYWYDFPGGSSLKAIYDEIKDKLCLPLDDFYFENITPKTTFRYGSAVTAWVNINAAKQYAEYDMTILDSDNNNGIISISDTNSYLVTDFDEKTLVSDLDFYGNFQLNEFKIDIKKAIEDTAGGLAWLGAVALGIPSSVTSSDGYFPISYHWNISMNKSENEENCVINGSGNRYKFLNGAKLEVGSGVTLQTSSLVAYRGEDYYSGRGGLASNLRKSKIVSTPSDIVVNGSLSGNVVAADIKTFSSNAKVEAKQSVSVTLNEPKNGSGDSLNAKMDDWYTIPTKLTLSHLERYSGSQFSDEDVSSTGTYSSEERSGSFGFVTNKTYFDIVYENSFDAKNSDSSFVENKVVWNDRVDEANKESAGINFGTPSYPGDEYYFDDRYGIFFFDSACSEPVPANVSINDMLNHINIHDKKIHIYLRWVKNDKDEFHISYEYVSANGNHETIQTNQEVITGQKNDVYNIKSFDDCKDYDVIKKENVSKTGYQFLGYSINGSAELIHPGEVTLARLRELVPEGNEIKLTAMFKETKYLWMQVNNLSVRGIFGNYNVITSVKINDSAVNETWVSKFDSIEVEVDQSRYNSNPKCTIKIGALEICSIGAKTTKTFKFEDYSICDSLFESGENSIILQASK